MAYWVADRETGTFIEKVDSIHDGIAKIMEYEAADLMDRNYTEGFYDIVDDEHISVMGKEN